MPSTSASAHPASRSASAWRFLLAAILLLVTAFGQTALAQSDIQGDPADARTDEDPVDDNPASLGYASSGVNAEILPFVRLTPRDLDVPDLDNHRISVNGTWQFVHAVPDTFDGTAASISDWAELEIPRHFALQGFPRMHREFGVPVAYTRTLDIPANWAGRTIILRFEGVDGYGKLWINGQQVGGNDIATLPSEYDITEFAKPGQANELVLTIEKSLVTHWSRRELGGITRDVYLQALPKLNLGRLHVDTDLDQNNTAATMNAHVRVANHSDQSISTASLAFSLTTADGQTVELNPAESTTLLPAIAAGQTLELTVPMKVLGFKTWTAETPHLYHIHAELKDGDGTVMSARQRFGFREVYVEGHQLLVNGSPVKLRGTNYHITHPDYGESVPREMIERDIKLFQGANFNALRSRPTPVYDYAELCDELGIYTTVEAMVSIMMYDRGPLGDFGADPSIAGPYRHHVATMIESYYSNPSVLTWGLGNECAYYDYFKVAALGMKKRDPSRPLFFGSDARLGVSIPYMDINDDHYPRDKTAAVADLSDLSRVHDPAWDYPEDRPIFFTEWLHVHTNNVKEIAFDPGVDEYWAAYAEIHLNHLYNVPHFMGGFHFKGAPYRNIGAPGIWRGVFDAQRRINDLYWHVQKSHSPVRIHETAGTYRDELTAVAYTVENRYDFTDLSEVTFAWKHGETSGEAKIEGKPHSRSTLLLPIDPEAEQPVELRVIDPNGHEVDRYHLTVRKEDLPTEAEEPETFDIDVTERGNHWIATVGDTTYRIDQSTGLITSASVDNRTVINGSPTLNVLPAQLRFFRRQGQLTLVNQVTDWQAESVMVHSTDNLLRITAYGGYADDAIGTMTTTIHSDGKATVAYDFTWTRDQEFNLFASGLQIPVAEGFDHFTWQRDAFWSVYPDSHIGRATGTAPATGDPAYADQRHIEQVVDGHRPWPWSQDKISGVTRDFRATRFDFHHGGLVHDSGTAAIILAKGRQHLQAIPANDDLDDTIFTAEKHGPRTDGFHLNVYDFHNGGTEPHLMKSIKFEEIIVKPGTRFTGEATLELKTDQKVHP
ncbi:glycoside hydrolase family 2 TIM barrel-domain containing protein [Mucisphaera sp.]|uniref:glycoside hydrolase family 2 TIM barrel-domain containing protein n=1 Tax=Mucisphaera sp. TaxID=2913024 RepID=UPI003D0D0B8E